MKAYSDSDEYGGSGISDAEVDPADSSNEDKPGPSQNGETVIVSDESNYSGISNEDDEDCEDDDDAMEWSVKEEEVLLSPKEEEMSADEEAYLAEEVPAEELLSVKEEIILLPEASADDFTGFEEPFGSEGPAKRERGSSDDASPNEREEDKVDDGDDDWLPSPASVKSEPSEEESSYSGVLDEVDDGDWLTSQPALKIEPYESGFSGVSFPPNSPNTVTQDRYVPIENLTGQSQKKRSETWKPKRKKRPSFCVYHCYYCPVFFNKKFYLATHVLDHLAKGDPKFEVVDPKTGHMVHSAYLEGTLKRGLPSNKNRKQNASDDKPYKCHLCHFKTKHLGVLRCHLKRKAKQALEPKRLSCFHCGWWAEKKVNLRKHMRKHILAPYKCEFCDHRAQTASKLKIHLRTHTGDKPYACYICGERFTQMFSQRRHMLTHGPVALQCTYCEFVADNGKILGDHIKDHLGSKNYGCPICDFETVDTTKLRSHMRSRHSLKLEKLQCRWCEFDAVKCTTLNNHERSHFAPYGYPCEECAYTTSSKSKLRVHMLTHTGEKRYACGLCDYRSTTQKSVTRHMITHSDASCRAFTCLHCDKTFKTKQTCQAHEKFVHQLVEKEYRCRYCEYRSHVKKTIQQHEKIHTGEKTFNCSLCDYVGRVKMNLVTHMRTHTRGGDHKCDYCNFTSVNSTGISTHMLVTHPTARPYACSYCSATFRLKPELIGHEREHIGDKKRPRRKGLVYRKLLCRLCPFETIPFNRLKSHYEEFHPDENVEVIPEFVEREKQEAIERNRKRVKNKRQCRFCNFQSTVRRTVRIHENIHLLQMGKIEENMELSE